MASTPVLRWGKGILATESLAPQWSPRRVCILNCVAPEDRERHVLDWLSDTPIEFASMGSIYDNLHIGDAAPLALSRPYEAQARDLKDRFPEEADAIDAWIAALRAGRDAVLKVTMTRAMPEMIGSALKWWHCHAIKRWCQRTTQEVIDAITDKRDLAAAFAAPWFDHGGRPGRPFPVCSSPVRMY